MSEQNHTISTVEFLNITQESGFNKTVKLIQNGIFKNKGIIIPSFVKIVNDDYGENCIIMREDLGYYYSFVTDAKIYSPVLENRCNGEHTGMVWVNKRLDFCVIKYNGDLIVVFPETKRNIEYISR